MNWTIAKITVTSCLAIAIMSAFIFPFVKDPVLKRGTFRTGDNRQHRLGSLSYEEVTDLQNGLIRLSNSESPRKRAYAIGQLTTIFRKRTMISESLTWLKRGLRDFPDDPHIKKEKAEMTKIIRRNMH